MLIDAIIRKDAEMTKVFALAVVPQASQCRTTTFNRLTAQLLGANPSFGKTDIILRDIQEIYSCFGLTCEDIGNYLDPPEDVVLPQCTIAKTDAAMAGYQPTSDVLPVCYNEQSPHFQALICL